MKKNRLTLTLTLIIAITSAGMAPTFSAVKPKSAGRTATSVPNTILNGKGAPTSVLGINGDFYIDTRSLSLYGPKKNGKWPSPQSLQGATGVAGTDGKNGSDGKSINNASTVSGATGPQGEKGEKGDAGLPGSPGAAGPAGTPGAKGDTGSSGSGTPGPKGDTGNTGSTGATGAKGETGTAGSVGATGAKGETGTAGAIGPSLVAVETMTYSDIQGGVGTSQSSSITGFKAGKSYLVKLKIVCFQPNDSFNNSVPLGLNVSAVGGTPMIFTQYTVANGGSYRSGSGSDRIEYSVNAEIVLNGASSADFSLAVAVIAGKSTSGSLLLKVQGSYVATLIGSVSSL